MSQPQIKYDPMGIPIRPVASLDLDVKYMSKLGVTFDPATGSTKPDTSEQVDLDALIQTYKGQCGMELAKRLIKQGVDPATFADDGKHSGDVTHPSLQSAQDIANAAIQAGISVEEIAKAFGIPANGAQLDDETLGTLVSKYIAEHYPNIIKQPEASGTNDGGAE